MNLIGPKWGLTEVADLAMCHVEWLAKYALGHCSIWVSKLEDRLMAVEKNCQVIFSHTPFCMFSKKATCYVMKMSSLLKHFVEVPTMRKR